MQKLRTEKDIANGISFLALNKNNKPIPELLPTALQRGFSKKRIDHRHHALDALVIACATKDHVNLLNNQYANSPKRYDLNRKLRIFKKVAYNHPQTGERIEREVPKEFIKPWNNFTITAKEALEKSIFIMIEQLKAVVGFEEPVEEKEVKKAEKNSETNKESDSEFLKTRIEALDLSVRTVNALSNANIRTVGGLAKKKEDDLNDIEGLGAKGIQEIKKALSNFGIILK